MNRQYLEYIPEVGTLAANSHHGQQHHLHQQPECKAASLSNLHSTKTCSSWADHVGGSVRLLIDDCMEHTSVASNVKQVVDSSREKVSVDSSAP